VAALRKEPKYRLAQASHRAAWERMMALRKWMVTTAFGSGPAYLASALKNFAADCRLAAIEQKNLPRSIFRTCLIGPLAGVIRKRDALCQLSYIGRALPKGRKDREGVIALEGHYSAFSSRPEVIPPE